MIEAVLYSYGLSYIKGFYNRQTGNKPVCSPMLSAVVRH